MSEEMAKGKGKSEGAQCSGLPTPNIAFFGSLSGPDWKGVQKHFNQAVLCSHKLHCVITHCVISKNYDFQSSYFGPALKSNQLIYSLTIHIQHALTSSFCLLLFNLTQVLLFYLSFLLITGPRTNKSMLLTLGWGGFGVEVMSAFSFEHVNHLQHHPQMPRTKCSWHPPVCQLSCVLADYITKQSYLPK